MPNPSEIPPPYTFAPLELLLARKNSSKFVLDVDEDAVQLVNVLLETVKLLLLTVVSPANLLEIVL